MIKTLGLKMLFTAIRMIVTKQLFEQIYNLVLGATSLEVSGPEKKAIVLAQIKTIKGDVSKTAKTIPNLILSMAIDIAYAEFNDLLGKV